MGFSTSALSVLHGAKAQSKEANSSHVLQREALYGSQACEAHPGVRSRRPFVSTGLCSYHLSTGYCIRVHVTLYFHEKGEIYTVISHYFRINFMRKFAFYRTFVFV